METTREAFWAIARIHRDRAWATQEELGTICDLLGDTDGPISDVERYWYLQGKAEAYASIMSEMESAR
jgi:hypothetical protein